MTLRPIPGVSPRQVVLCILDGIGWGRRDDTDAVFTARTPTLDRLWSAEPHCLLRAHGTAVGLPSDADMGNSEVGHNAMGAGRVVVQGATLVERALATGALFESEAWKAMAAADTLHFLGLLSDGGVHSHVDHLRAMIAHAAQGGHKRIRVHLLTDGRDVSGRSALSWIEPLEADFTRYTASGCDVSFASGGGRMAITMDRYEADWSMVERGWRCHVHGEGRQFGSASEAVRTLYAEAPEMDDQWLPPFVVAAAGEPVGRIRNGDAVCFFNFRGDRAIEITRAFEEGPDFSAFDRGEVPEVVYTGMMQYDGDLHLPKSFLVPPPEIDQTVGELFAANGVSTFAISETQKFGHVTYFFNGNRSGLINDELELYEEIPSDRLPFNEAPAMKARKITARAVRAIRERACDHVRLNLANGDMVGHTGDFPATVTAVEEVDACLAELEAACRETGAILLVTADHGNADEMYELDKKGAPILVDGRPKPRTSHSLNPVPFILVDPLHEWVVAAEPGAGIANIGATLLHLRGLTPPPVYLPSLVRRAD